MTMKLYYDGKNIDSPSVDDLKNALRILNTKDCALILDSYPRVNGKPEQIDIRSNGKGYYLPTVAVQNGEFFSREFYNEELYGTPFIVIGGYEYDPTFLTKDYDRICRMVWEFYETGNVTDELLQ